MGGGSEMHKVCITYGRGRVAVWWWLVHGRDRSGEGEDLGGRERESQRPGGRRGGRVDGDLGEREVIKGEREGGGRLWAEVIRPGSWVGAG
ncbi:hypothetical protein HAX54_029457 [Datura stramonium]|uniref:Uncharacterized protein n=1 Tax=Datura stramonium TaxID=4076 RepID=A0ABS8V601_DATST|nr:hypothetical protein [Datura stramonium]